jgi:Amt family ammonium transporter
MLLLTACSLGLAQDRSNDPSGASTGNAADVAAANPGTPTVEEIAAQVGHNKVAINMMWVLITGFIVMFMQTVLLWLKPA